MCGCCFQWFKDTKMRANHNQLLSAAFTAPAVSNGSKILKWEQITTIVVRNCFKSCCFQWFKDTKMRANHNEVSTVEACADAVSNGSKILKWEQITTIITCFNCYYCCFQWFKDTKMRANHNVMDGSTPNTWAVSNGSKILKWEQITTVWLYRHGKPVLFPMVQRY